MQALVSIIVPTYNRGHIIGETVQSVIDQTYENWELLVVDDGSEDGTKDAVGKFQDARIKYFGLEHSGVIGKVRNYGIKAARGEYVAFLDSDDVWLAHKLEYQLSLLRKYPHASFAFGHGDQFGAGATPTPELEEFFVGDIFQPFLFEKRFIFYVPTLLFRKGVLDRITPVDENLSYAGDIDFFLRMAFAVEGVFSHDVVARIRKQEKSHSQSNERRAYDEYLVMLNKHRGDGRLTQKQFVLLASRHHYRQGLLHLRNGEPSAAVREFREYLNSNPLHWKGWIRLVQSQIGDLLRKLI